MTKSQEIKDFALRLADSLNACRKGANGRYGSEEMLESRGWKKRPRNKFSSPYNKGEEFWIAKALKQERRRDVNLLLKSILGKDWKK